MEKDTGNRTLVDPERRPPKPKPKTESARAQLMRDVLDATRPAWARQKRDE